MKFTIHPSKTLAFVYVSTRLYSEAKFNAYLDVELYYESNSFKNTKSCKIANKCKLQTDISKGGGIVSTSRPWNFLSQLKYIG